jgi:biopolymer transport protein TolR
MRKRINHFENHEMMSRINVTPLVDVMLVLLIIFMITSPMMIAGVSVDLPETSASPVTAQEEPLSVTVDKKGRIYIQDTKIARKELADKLIAITKNNKKLRIYVRGDKNISYGHVMDVMGIINAAGFNKVALITDLETQ